MRPLPALAAAVALLAAASIARAMPMPGGRTPVLPSLANGHRAAAAVRIAPVGGELAYTVDLDITYLAGITLPQVDAFPTGSAEPSDVAVRGDGLDVGVLPPGQRMLTWSVAQDSARPPRVVHVHFRQAFPRAKRYGWTTVRAELDWALGSFQVARDVVTTVVVPAGVALPGFDCQPSGAGRECTRAAQHWMAATTVVAAAPVDPLGLFLVAVTVAGSVYGFEQMRRKRARELLDEARARPLMPAEVPGGAYREPPRGTVGAIGDAAEERRALDRRAAAIAAAAAVSTAAVAALVSGHSPWPMAWVTAAWIAVVGFAGSLLVERM